MLSSLLRGVVDYPTDFDRHLIMADWVEEHDDTRRAELLRLHRRLLATCTEPDKHPERAAWQARLVALLGDGVQPVVPRQVHDLGNGVTIEMAWCDGFWMGVHQVTQAQWQAIMGNNPSHFRGDNLPVETVSWHDCQDFCRRLSERTGQMFRLPTEAEWEYACRAGTTTEFWWGNTATSHQANFDGNYPYGGAEKGAYLGRTSPVGSYLPNPFGLYDTHGNVWEWCGLEGEQRPDPTSAAGAGTDTPGAAGRRSASGSTGHSGTTSWASASQEDEHSPDPTVARSGCSGAGAGSATPGTAGRRAATGTTRRRGTTSWASASQEGEHSPVPTGSSEVGAGSASPGTAGRRTATGSSSRTGSTSSDSESAEGEQRPNPTSAAAVGAPTPRTAGRRTASGSRRRTGSTSSVFASAEGEQSPNPISAAAAGSTSAGSAGRRSASGSTRRSGTATSAFALPEDEQSLYPTFGAGVVTAPPRVAGRRTATGVSHRSGSANSDSESAEGENSPRPTSGAGAGTVSPGTAGRRTATGSPHRTGTSAWAFASPEYDTRVLRGGSRYIYPRFCRAAFRRWLAPGDRDHHCGCRVVLCLD